MKMEQDLCASRDGVVELLTVEQGDQVPQGAELLRLAEL
jgi:biotin carboxyl carrier protein